MVLSLSLSVGFPVTGSLIGSVMILNDWSKNMKVPKYIRIIITISWYDAITKICLHILESIICSFLLILGGSVLDSHLGSSVPNAIAPKMSITRLAQSI